MPIDALFPTATNLKQTEWIERLKEAYRTAEESSRKASTSFKRQYDKKLRSTLLSPGDRVLVRNLSKREGPGKLRSYWEDKIHVVEKQIHDDWPVYQVQQEDGQGTRRVLHRNLLFQCDGLPRDDVSEEHQEGAMLEEAKTDDGPVEDDDDAAPEEGSDQELDEVMGEEDAEEGEAGTTDEECENEEVVGKDEEPGDTSMPDPEESDEEEEPPPRGVRKRRVRRILTYDALGQPSHKQCLAIIREDDVEGDFLKQGESVIMDKSSPPPTKFTQAGRKCGGGNVGTARWAGAGGTQQRASVLPRPRLSIDLTGPSHYPSYLPQVGSHYRAINKGIHYCKCLGESFHRCIGPYMI